MLQINSYQMNKFNLGISRKLNHFKLMKIIMVFKLSHLSLINLLNVDIMIGS